MMGMLAFILCYFILFSLIFRISKYFIHFFKILYLDYLVTLKIILLLEIKFNSDFNKNDDSLTT